METFRSLGIEFLSQAMVLLPIFYAVVAAEYVVVRMLDRSFAQRSGFQSLVLAQVLSPPSFFAIYSVIPGSTADGAWIHISEKMVNAGAATGLLCSVVFVAGLAVLTRVAVRHWKKPNQSSEPTPGSVPPAADAPVAPPPGVAHL